MVNPDPNGVELALSADGRVAALLAGDKITVLGSGAESFSALSSFEAKQSTGVSISDSGHKLLVTTGNTGVLWDVSIPDRPLKQGRWCKPAPGSRALPSHGMRRQW